MTTDVDRAYQRGYKAGRARAKRDASDRARRAHERALWQRAMVAALPFALTQQTWRRGSEAINTVHDRVTLAAEVADQAVEVARNRGKLL